MVLGGPGASTFMKTGLENNPILKIVNIPPHFLSAFVCGGHMLLVRIWIGAEMRTLAGTRARVRVVDVA